MSDRERWIVYPLLFLALGAALRDKFIPPAQLRARSIAAEELAVRAVTAERLQCVRLQAGGTESVTAQVQSLAVAGPNGAQRIRLAVLPNQAGQLVLYGRDGRPIVAAGADEPGRDGVLETFAADGRGQVKLRSAEGNGVVSAVAAGGDAACILGSDGTLAGVFLELPKLKRVVPLSAAPLPKPAEPTEGKPDPTDAAAGKPQEKDKPEAD